MFLALSTMKGNKTNLTSCSSSLIFALPTICVNLSEYVFEIKHVLQELRILNEIIICAMLIVEFFYA